MTGPTRLSSSLLEEVEGVSHGFFTRRGGVSSGVYRSLNAGPGSPDDPALVTENRRRVASAFRRPAEALLTAYQVHGAEVVIADEPWEAARPRADGVATRVRGLICAVLTADCAPVLLADPEARVVAAVHAGWRGALTGVIERGVETMVAAGASRVAIVAAVGPCIGPASYEVREDFRTAFASLGAAADPFFARAGGRLTFDLPGFVLSRIEKAGVARAEWIGRDTFAEPALFFSNRRGHLAGRRDYGRLLSGIMIE